MGVAAGPTEKSHHLVVAARIRRLFWSTATCQPGDSVDIHLQTEGVADGTSVSLTVKVLVNGDAFEVSAPPTTASIKEGAAKVRWKTSFSKENFKHRGFTVLSLAAEIKSPAVPLQMAENQLLVARRVALVSKVDRCFIPGAEMLGIRYTVVDPGRTALSGLLRIYGNQYEHAAHPDKKAVVFQRLLSKEELRPGEHLVEWNGHTEAASGPLKPDTSKGEILYLNPMHSPYVAEIQLLDREHRDASSWPSSDAIPSAPAPSGFQGLGLKKAGGKVKPTAAGELPTLSGFEVVYGGIELRLGTFLPDESKPPAGDALYHYRLNQLGYFCGPVGSGVDSLTQQGIKEFKRNHGEVVEDPKKGRYEDIAKPLGNPEPLKVKGDLDAKTKATIEFLHPGRTWMAIYDASGKPVPGRNNTLPGPAESGRILIDANIFYQKEGEFWNSKAGKPDTTKQKRDLDWLPRPWIPVEAHPLLVSKRGSLASRAQSAFGAAGARVLWRVQDPGEDHAGLGFPSAPFPPLAFRNYTVVAGDTMKSIAKSYDFKKVSRIYDDPENKAFKKANPNKNHLTPGATVKIPPFENYRKYVAHKEGQPEKFVNKMVAHYAGKNHEAWIADNAPDEDGGKKIYGIRTHKEDRRGVESLRHGNHLLKLEPWTPHEVADEDAGHGKAIAVPILGPGPKRGASGLFFVPGTLAGDNYRLEAWIDLKKGADGKDHPNAEALKARYAAGSPRALTGTMTVWRRTDLAAYLSLKDRTAEPLKLAQVDWARVQAIYRAAYIDLRLPSAAGRRLLSEDEYKAIVASIFPALKREDIVLDREELYPTKSQPFPKQKKNESVSHYLARVKNVVSTFHEDFGKNARKHLQISSRTGGVIVDFRRNYKPIPLKTAKGKVHTGYDFESDFLSTGQSRGVLLLDQRDPDKGQYVLCHELGHLLFLYHWTNTGEDNTKDHDNDDPYCIMMYSEGGEVKVIDPDFCGKCLMKLRGWNEQVLPKHGPAGTGAKGKGKGKGDSKKLKVGTLMISDGSDEKFVAASKAYGKLSFKDAKSRLVKSYDELVKTLEEYESIDRLILDFHGIPGGMILGHEVKDLSQVVAMFKGTAPEVGEIEFEGCNVGSGPAHLVKFGRHFGTAKISGWNHFRVYVDVTITVPRGGDETTRKKVMEILAPYKDYFIPGTPSADVIARTPGTHKLYAEWFREDFDETPLPTDRDTFSKGKTFKPRKTGTTRAIKSGEVEKLEEEYESNPVPPLENVVITITD